MKTHIHPIAFDRGSVRTVDAQGFLHVPGCNISKACVNPYFGAEIPDYEQLGLQRDKVYYLLRDPKELEKAASTFNNLPLMDDHVAVSVDGLEDPEVKDRIVGSTGTSARFEDPYLINDLVIWTAKGIDGVMSKAQTQLSCAYRYKLDMTPGTFEGQPYDGRMYDLVGNHVALVDEGRAGPDVIVKDKKPSGIDKLRVQVDMRNVVKLVTDALAPVKKALDMDDDDEIDSIVDALTELKARVTKLKSGVTADEDDAKALDDCTSAIDLAVHHLLDIKEDEDEASLDANPEGINQYSGGGGGKSSPKELRTLSNRAIVASGTANATRGGKTGDAHAKAAEAHKAAAASARSVGSPTFEKYHNEHAAYHARMASRNAHDANPEGINQYNGAASHADKVGKAAGKPGGPSHKDAQAAHQRAAVAANKAGNSSATSTHLRVAAAHGALHSDPSNTTAKATLAGHYGKGGDANPEGINQYTGGLGAKAAEHSAKAANHEKRVSELTQKARSGGISKSEMGKLNAHRAAASAHREAAGNYKYAANNPKEGSGRAEQQHYLKGWSNAANHASEIAGDAALATDKIVHMPGHKDSSGKAAPWVIKSETTGGVIWSGGSKEDAVANLKRIEGHKQHANDEGGGVTCDVAEREDVSPKEGKSKYGNVKFADMKNKKYPLDTPDHVRSAASYWGRAKNRNMYSEEDQTTITNNIEAAKKKFKIGEYAESK